MKNSIGLVLGILFCCSGIASPQIKNVRAFQQYPWGKVYISYEVEGSIASNATSGIPPFLHVYAQDRTTQKVLGEVTSGSPYLTGDIGLSAGKHKIIWDVCSQGIVMDSSAITFIVQYRDDVYMVIDLSAGANASRYPVTYMAEPPSDGFNTDLYKTKKLVLRCITPGTFKMGGEYNVTLTRYYFMGIFEVTQKQYALVMGNNPSKNYGDKRPVEYISFNTIRGSKTDGANWPASSIVDPSSFMGKLRARTGLNFDLPTEAQWEYACRAGTTSAYNNGGRLSIPSSGDLAKLGRYLYSPGYSYINGDLRVYGTASVGSYEPNVWGLYDMHGNVQEWCLDWYGDLSNGQDPKGPNTGDKRILRGGGWLNPSDSCTSSSRNSGYPYSVSEYSTIGGELLYNSFGFRLVWNMSN